LLFGLAAVLVTLSLLVWNARRESAINRLFCVQTLFFAAWVLGIAGLHTGQHPVLWGRVTFAAATLIPGTFLAFSRLFPVPVPWPPDWLLHFSLAIGGVLAATALLTPLVVSDVRLLNGELLRTPGPLYPIFALFFLSVWVAAIVVLVRKWSHVRGLARAQLQYLSAAILLSGTGAIVANLLHPLITGTSAHSWLGPFFSLVFVLIVGHAIIRHQLLDLRIVINQGLSRILAAGVLSLMLVAAWRLLFGERAAGIGEEGWVTLIAVLITFSTPAQRLFAAVIDPYLYRGRLDYPAAVREATHRLSKLMSVDRLRGELTELVTDAYRPESVLFFIGPDQPPATGDASRSGQGEGAIVEWATRALNDAAATSAVLVMEPTTGDTEEADPRRHLARRGVEIVVGLRRRGRLLGGLVLGPRRSGDAYFARDLQLLESIAELASVSLENSLLYREQLEILEYSNRLLESLSSAVVAIDDRGRLTSLNAAALALLGVAEHRRGATIDVLPSDIAWLLALCARGAWRPRDLEIVVEGVGRLPFPAIVSTAALTHAGGETAGALVVITDLTTVKDLEHDRRRLEHLTLMARFYAGIAHEIRSPLTSISSFIALLPERFDDPDYRDTAARLLPDEVSRIVQLAERLRLMAPSEGGTLGPVRLPAFLNDLVALLKPGGLDARITVALECPESLPEILGDRGQLTQLFHNLIRNAQDAMPDGGEIRIRAQAGSARGGGVTITVVDEGTGIDPGLTHKVFEPFFTTKPSGTGLGLSICREIADFHHAQLTLGPRSDRAGTIARLDFPARTAGPFSGAPALTTVA
jgi:signal transduction histidine kinase